MSYIGKTNLGVRKKLAVALLKVDSRLKPKSGSTFRPRGFPSVSLTVVVSFF